MTHPGMGSSVKVSAAVMENLPQWFSVELPSASQSHIQYVIPLQILWIIIMYIVCTTCN